MIGPVSVTDFSKLPDFLTLFIFPALLKHNLFGLMTSTIRFFLGPGDPPLSGNFNPLALRFPSLSVISG
jgi:hypothetical protein